MNVSLDAFRPILLLVLVSPSLPPSLRLPLCQSALQQIARLQPQLRPLFDVFTHTNVPLSDYTMFVSLHQSAKKRSHLLATGLRVRAHQPPCRLAHAPVGV